MLGEEMADQVALVRADIDDLAIAGALNFVGADALYGRNWGCAGRYKFLHFEACYYRAIDFAIERGLTTVEADRLSVLAACWRADAAQLEADAPTDEDLRDVEFVSTNFNADVGGIE